MAHEIGWDCISCGACVFDCPVDCIYDENGNRDGGTPPSDAIISHCRTGTNDLNTKFVGRGSSNKRSNVGIISNGQDISNLFFSISEGGTVGPNTGLKTGSTDIATLFAKKGSVGGGVIHYPNYNDGIYTIDPNVCTDCGACAEVCPPEAISS